MGQYDIVSGQYIPDVEDYLVGAGAGYDFVGAQARSQLLANPQALAMLQGGGGGFAPRPAPQQYAGQFQAAMQQAIAQRAAQGGAVLRSMNPTKARRQPIGMVSNGTIAAGGTATITARPQTFAYKPERIVIPATIAPDFVIQDIKVGNISQLVQSGDLPAEMFVQGGVDVGLDMDTVQTSQDFILLVQNISSAARTFRAGVVGRSANG